MMASPELSLRMGRNCVSPVEKCAAASDPIQVIVTGISGVLLQLVTNLIREQPDMWLVETTPQMLDDTLTSSGTCVLVLGAHHVYPPPGICLRLLREHAELRVLVLASNGDAAEMYWRGMRRSRLSSVAPSALMNGIRRLRTLDPVTTGRIGSE